VRHRQHFAIAAVAVGALLAATGAVFSASAWNLVRSVATTQQHDTYFVMPGMSLLILFSVGVVGDIVFRRHSAKLALRGDFIWQAHLAVTTVLLLAALLAAAQSDKAWALITVALASAPLMLLAHGAALAAGGVIVLRAKKPS